jgi:hypothetical protein
MAENYHQQTLAHLTGWELIFSTRIRSFAEASELEVAAPMQMRVKIFDKQ